MSSIADEPVLINPRTRFADHDLTLPPPGFPGLHVEFPDPPEDGAKTYKGSGRLKGRRALITGGDSGIGRAVAVAYMREGAKVAINYLPEEEPDAESLAEVFRKDGKELIRIPGNLRDEKFCAELVHEAHKCLGGLDILVSNAGYFSTFPQPTVDKIETGELLKLVETNIYPSIFLARAAVPLMPPGSAIIHTASGITDIVFPGFLIYAGTKGFIEQWSYQLSSSLYPLGIRVACVKPGPIFTPGLPGSGYTTEDVKEQLALQPAQRFGQPIEIAPAYVSLADSENSFSSGASYEVYGVAT